nr:MAG TPA: hypothetical protein [Caudoviricetes sp.]
MCQKLKSRLSFSCAYANYSVRIWSSPSFTFVSTSVRTL